MAVNRSNLNYWWGAVLASNPSLPLHFPGSRLLIPNPFCVRPAPMMRIGALREVLVCSRDEFTGDPAREGFAADGTSANPLPSLNSSSSNQFSRCFRNGGKVGQLSGNSAERGTERSTHSNPFHTLNQSTLTSGHCRERRSCPSPSRTNARTIASPIPVAPPVTTATFPLRRNLILR